MAQRTNNKPSNGTATEETDGSLPETTPTLHLRLEQPRDERRVIFHEGVIDNEHLNRKKSKCCCIYKKPLAFGESSSEDDEECENCFGHPEKRKRNARHNHNHDNDNEPSTSAQASAQPGPSVGDPISPPAEPVVSPVKPKSDPTTPIDQFEQTGKS
ncbi:E3 ubiquitin-protein ligase PPP1R11 [Drosophila pseudoobscura]|uniref:E3 ubiquitin-protein ligase PPP1R11 n=1 Tax=Drosophila pseudoobscura pseudoobscura TaxID=46245 RepID=Q29PN7_DROPS|nr:E3 ubiquitin-protein ligase PPP1R11 [Drosophila pseudoobscura]